MSWRPGYRVFSKQQLKALRAEVEAAEPAESFCGDMEKRVYLGSILSLTPSGKLYTPFACGNLEPCPKCRGREGARCPCCGETGSREAYLDQRWWEQLEKELESVGLWWVGGEGDACDIFVGMSVEAMEPAA